MEFFPNEDNFSIKFINENTTFYNIDNNEIDLSIYEYDYIDIKLPSSSWIKDSDNKNLIDFKYDVSKIKLNYIYQSSYNHTLSYQIQTIEEFKDSNFIVIFNDTEYKIDISSFSPSKDEYHILSNDELNDNYKEFKEMLDSIKYHYYESPYVGLDVLRDDRVRDFYFNYEFNDEYNLDYLLYLKDDTFILLNLILQNLI